MYTPNSEIRIPIYKLKYIVGDIIYIPNKNNKAGVYLKIINSFVRFSEFEVNNGNAQTPSIVDAGYAGQIMLGSNYDTHSVPTGKALVGYLTIDALDVDIRAKFVAHKKDDYILFDRKTLMVVIDAIESNLERQAIETNALMQ